MLEFLKASEAARRWGISDRRVRRLCEDGRIAGAVRQGRIYLIPADAEKPADGRTLRASHARTEKTQELLARIDALRAQYEGGNPLAGEELEKMLVEFAAGFAYESNALAGSMLTLRETALVLAGRPLSQHSLREQLHVIGHTDAFRYVVTLVRRGTQLSEPVIRQIHAFVVLTEPPETRGQYRSVPAPFAHKDTPAGDPEAIAGKLRAIVREFVTGRRHAIVRSALFHLKFGQIHPFAEANGRTGRLLLNLCLMLSGYPPVDVKLTDKAKYASAFTEYLENQDPAPMLELITGYLEEQLTWLLSVTRASEKAVRPVRAQ